MNTTTNTPKAVAIDTTSSTPVTTCSNKSALNSSNREGLLNTIASAVSSSQNPKATADSLNKIAEKILEPGKITMQQLSLQASKAAQQNEKQLNTTNTANAVAIGGNSSIEPGESCSTKCACHFLNAEDIANEMKAAIEGSKEYQLALTDYSDFVQKTLRIENSIKEIMTEESALLEEKAQLSVSFGEEDPKADTDRLEAINNRLSAINESRGLLKKRMDHNGNITRQKEDMENGVRAVILRILPDIQKRYQAEVDKQVKNLVKTIETYSSALSSIRSTCKTKDGKHRVYISSLSTARIEIKDFYKLKKFSDDMPVM